VRENEQDGKGGDEGFFASVRARRSGRPCVLAEAACRRSRRGSGNLASATQSRITEADLTTPQQVIQLGYPPRRIDLLTTIDGVEFDACRATGRPQDRADLDSLGEPPEDAG
jgi:hypothetical protein